MASRSLTDLHPLIRPHAEDFLRQCPHAFITCTYRSNEEQDEAYAQGRTQPGKIITFARAGQSPHNCTRPDGTPGAKAFDIAILTPDGTLDWSGSSAAWLNAISVATELGLECGANWPHPKQDRPHFQLFNWENIP